MNTDERLANAFAANHPEDAARLLERCDPDDVAAILSGLPAAHAAAVFRALSPSPAAACAAIVGAEQLAAILELLPLDAAAGAARRLSDDRRGVVLALLTDERRASVERRLAFPENSAGAVCDPLVVTLPADMSVADAQRQLRGSARHVYYYLYVVDRNAVLVGTLAIPELMSARPRQPLSAVMQRNLVRLDARTDLATVASHPAWRDLDALPVVDASGRMLGAIRHQLVRQMHSDAGRPMVTTLVQLSEAYWAGLSAILASLAPPASQPRPEEATDVS